MIGTEVDVYFNLHKRLWSVRDRKTRSVVAHVEDIVLADVTFRVSPAGNARVRREGRKNVHAFASGTVVDAGDFGAQSNAVGVTYDPHRDTTFVERGTFRPVHSATMAWLAGKSVMAEISA